MFQAAQIMVREPVVLSATLESAKRIQGEIINMRRHVHAHPELGFREFETSKFAAARLKDLGFEVRSFANHPGLIADYGGGDSMVAIRTDMDASAIHELNRTGYASRNPGVMHACGHDAHLACTLGAAELLTKMNIKGRIRIIVQPGDSPDEKPGVTTMMESGCLEDVDAVLGLHVDATLPSQRVGVVCGATSVSEQSFRIAIDDNESRRSAMLEAARMVVALSEMTFFRTSDIPIGELILDSVRAQRDATRASVPEAEIRGVLKTFGEEIRVQAHEEIIKVVQSLNSKATIEFGNNNVSAVESARIIDILRQSAVDLVGLNEVQDIRRRSWNSQFSMLTEQVPGAMIYLGAAIASSRRTHQSQTFDIDENCLHVGAAVLAETAMRIINNV